MKKQMSLHIPVLADEIIEYAPEEIRTVLDCTMGGGGHSLRILESFPKLLLYGIDRDGVAIQASKEKLQKFDLQVELRQSRFSELESWLVQWNQQFDYVLADIGISSFQLAQKERGFSFRKEGPLDMRMDEYQQTLTAGQILAKSSEINLRKMLKIYGEEPHAAKIARALVASRKKGSLETTTQLAELVSKCIPQRFHKTGFHPATKTFQALRISVNDELLELEILLKVLPRFMKPKSRLAVICFHSLEDRLVKHAFRKWAHPCRCPRDLPYCVCGLKSLGTLLTRRPRTAREEEILDNTRSRSAKLRVFEFH